MTELRIIVIWGKHLSTTKTTQQNKKLKVFFVANNIHINRTDSAVQCMLKDFQISGLIYKLKLNLRKLIQTVFTFPSFHSICLSLSQIRVDRRE